MLWKVVGYIRLKFEGGNIFEFIEVLKANHIELKNIRKLKNCYYGDILSSKLRNVIKLGKKASISIRVEGRFGIAMKIFVYRNRIAFMMASIVFCLIFAFNSLFVKRIYISGNSYLTDSQLEEIVSECGCGEGSLKPLIKSDILKEKIMKKCDHLSFVWVDIKGTSAYVDVREKISKPEFFKSDYPCNIVAEKDGVISRAVAQAGTLYAKEGSYVRKGELLIGGVYDSNEYAPLRLVHSKGEVYAKTKYFLQGPVVTTKTIYKKDEKTKNVLGIKANKGSMYFGSEPENMSFNVEKMKEIKIFGKNYFSLAFTNKKYCEIIKTEYKMGYDEALKETIHNLSMRLESVLPDDAKIINRENEEFEDSCGNSFVKITFECLEEIGTELPIGVSP